MREDKEEKRGEEEEEVEGKKKKMERWRKEEWKRRKGRREKRRMYQGRGSSRVRASCIECDLHHDDNIKTILISILINETQIK